MINYAVYLVLKEKLGEMSGLTIKLKANTGNYAMAVAEYLVALQKIADEHRLVIASDVAIALQKICSFDGKGGDTGKRRNPRKERDDYALNRLADLQIILKSFYDKYDKIYEECSDVCRQIIAQIMTYNPLVIQKSKDVVAEIIAIASNEDALKPYYSHVIGSLGIYNARAVFDIVLPSMGF